ncbi:PaeR7I family type II restriction endonuclease [Roseateles sp.]|uniref:PaeR7I family type II restriction endonuclease n=1 Tax=Roseateles sp. TaxID=1971397 RepID=UPI003946E018
MSLNLGDYEAATRRAIKTFWGSRQASLSAQATRQKLDAGTRGAVTSGKNLNGFIDLISDIVYANGLPKASIQQKKGLVVLPGYFRPTKQWDLLIMNNQRLIAALEFKSQVGSFGNNYNNRTEEAIGTAQCLWTAYREGGLGDSPKPFLGWLMVVEDAPGSTTPVRNESPHFPVFSEFQGASYLDRYELLCQKLVKEQLYTSACVLATPATAKKTGAYRELSAPTGLGNFLSTLAGHVASEAARQRT